MTGSPSNLRYFLYELERKSLPRACIEVTSINALGRGLVRAGCVWSASIGRRRVELSCLNAKERLSRTDRHRTKKFVDRVDWLQRSSESQLEGNAA